MHSWYRTCLDYWKAQEPMILGFVLPKTARIRLAASVSFLRVVLSFRLLRRIAICLMKLEPRVITDTYVYWRLGFAGFCDFIPFTDIGNGG